MFRSRKKVPKRTNPWPLTNAASRFLAVSLMTGCFLIEPAFSQDFLDPSITAQVSEKPPSLRRAQSKPTEELEKERKPNKAAPNKTAPKKTRPKTNATFRDYYNYDIPGFDIGGGDAANDQGASGCESTCKSVRGCVAYTYDIWNQRCFLKSGADTRRFDARSASGVMSEIPAPRKSRTPITFEYFNNYKLWGMALGGEKPARSRDQCKSMCEAAEECVAFTFDKKASGCTIYHKPMERTPQPDSDSASKVQR